MQTFEQLVNMVKNKKVNTMGQELNREIVEAIKSMNVNDPELRRELNKDRIKALGLKLIQGGKA